MATETLKRKALQGIVQEIRHHNETCVALSIKVADETEALVELPRREFNQLNISISDCVNVFPIQPDVYLIIGKATDA